MKTTHAGKLCKFLVGGGLAVSTLGIAAVVVPAAANAQTCTYNSGGSVISCTPPSETTNQSIPPASTSSGGVQPATTASSSTLPLTGADIEELVAIGGSAILIGGLLVRRSRRRAHATATATVPGLVLADRTVWSQWQSGSPTTQG